MEKIRRRRLNPYSAVSSGEGDVELPSPQEVIDGLGPDAFGEKEPEEGARALHKKLTDFADQSPELSPELVSEEAPEAFFLGAETKLKDVEADMGKEGSNASHDEREDFSKGVDIIHALFSGDEEPSSDSPLGSAPDEKEVQKKIDKFVKNFKPSAPAA